MDIPSTDLMGGGGGGTSDGMEPRVKRLEDNFDKMGRDVADLRVQMAPLTERVAHLPSKGFIVTTTVTGLSVIAAIVLFADKLRVLVAG